MSNETLTAEERYQMDHAGGFADAPWCHTIRKLLRLYDAALARAEAAERKLNDPSLSSVIRDKLAAESALAETEANYADLLAHRNELQDQADSAESRLAEATALLEECMAEDLRNPVYHNVRTFLSSTQAPAAAWDIRGKEPVLVPAPAAYGSHAFDLAELRVCQALIADLERELAAARENFEQAMSSRMVIEQALNDSNRDNRALRAAIDAAVVELEVLYKSLVELECEPVDSDLISSDVDDIKEALRAAQKAAK